MKNIWDTPIYPPAGVPNGTVTPNTAGHLSFWDTPLEQPYSNDGVDVAPNQATPKYLSIWDTPIAPPPPTIRMPNQAHTVIAQGGTYTTQAERDALNARNLPSAAATSQATAPTGLGSAAATVPSAVPTVISPSTAAPLYTSTPNLWMDIQQSLERMSLTKQPTRAIKFGYNLAQLLRAGYSLDEIKRWTAQQAGLAIWDEWQSVWNVIKPR